MKEELALELKNAGFPYNPETHSLVNESAPCDAGTGCMSTYCVPTLSELIEACGGGKRLFELTHGMGKGHGWYAVCRGHRSLVCSTPEEAVALLWLALNKK